MFNICNSKTNGELQYYNNIKDKIKVIFDVGCRTDSEFLNFKGEVHYFDPVDEFINACSKQKTTNSKSFFNGFGLGDENKSEKYYPSVQSFLNRTKSCPNRDYTDFKILNIKRADEYIISNNVETIDFLKIDTEGYELDVLKGFGEKINICKYIQFEYGGTYIDREIKLKDVVDYLVGFGFKDFSYLHHGGKTLITDYTDHYKYCNIVCVKT